MNCNSNTVPLLKQSVTMSCNNGCTPKDINVICKKIIIPTGQEILGVQGENDISKRYFLIPKITESGDDLSNAQFNIITKSKTNGVESIKIKQTEILENYIKLEWKIDINITNVSGELQVQIEATKDNVIWKTYPATFIIASSLDEKDGDIIHPVDKKYVDIQDKNVLKDAEEYADNQDKKVLKDAKEYADNQDKNVLKDAKEYTDAQVPNIVETYIEEHKEELKGKDGTDGFSPSASVTQTETGATVTITDKTGTTTAEIKNGTNGKDGTNGTNGTNGTDGFSPSASVTQTETGATVTITDKTGTTTAEIKNGTNGKDGTNGTNGTNGTDGFSPSASVTQTETGATVTITDKTGTTTAEIKNGTNGKDGTNGTDGTNGKNYSVEIVESALTTQEIESNKFYKFGEVSSLNITLAAITDTSVLNEFMFEFISGTTATTLTLPNAVKWLEKPSIESNKTYQCSIVNNIGILAGVANV
jgi:hypothetical protein